MFSPSLFKSESLISLILKYLIAETNNHGFYGDLKHIVKTIFLTTSEAFNKVLAAELMICFG